MKYGMLQKGMWLMFRGSFAKAAESELSVKDGKELMRKAKRDYRIILDGIPEFDPESRFLVNILSCAMVVALLKNLEEKPDVDTVRTFYKKAMCENRLMQIFVKSGNSYTEKGQKELERDALASQSRTNPYDWKFTYEAGDTLNRYTATFTTCGICRLMKDYGFYEYVPALCTLDYDMAEMNNTTFTRAYTLASGGPYCDCHYDHRRK